MKRFFLLVTDREIGNDHERDRVIAGLTPAERIRRSFSRLGIHEVDPAELNFRQEAGGNFDLFIANEDRIFDFDLFETLLENSQHTGQEGVLFTSEKDGASSPIGLAFAPASTLPSLLILEEDRAFFDFAQAFEKYRRIPLSGLRRYRKHLRKTTGPRYFDSRTDAKSEIEKHLLHYASKGTNDFIARYIHPWPQDVITSWLWPHPWISPNLVTIINILFGIGALFCFLKGFFTIGALMASLFSLLDGVDGKLARTTVRFSHFGHLMDHVSDQIIDSLWYLAIGWALGQYVRWPIDPFIATWFLIFFYFIDRIATGLFSVLHPVELHDYRKFDRWVRILGARRSNSFFILFVGGVFGSFAQTYAFILFYTAITALVKSYRHVFIRINRLPSDILPPGGS